MDWNINWDAVSGIGSAIGAAFSALAFWLAYRLAAKRILDELAKLKVTRAEERRAEAAERVWAATLDLFSKTRVLDLRGRLHKSALPREVINVVHGPRIEFGEAHVAFRDALGLADIWLEEVDGLTDALTEFAEAASRIATEIFAFSDSFLTTESGIHLRVGKSLDELAAMQDAPWTRLDEAQKRVRKILVPIARHEERKAKAPPKGSEGST